MTPDCIARIFKTFMISQDKQSNKVLNSLIGGLSQVFQALTLDSLASVSTSLAVRKLPQADVFAEIGNSMLECVKDQRGRAMNDQARLDRVHY